MKAHFAIIAFLLVAGCSEGGAFSSEPGPITDEQFVQLKEECGLPDAKLVSSNRTSSFTTNDGIPVTVTNEGNSASSRTVILSRKRSNRQLAGVVMCLAEFQDRTGAEFITNPGGGM